MRILKTKRARAITGFGAIILAYIFLLPLTMAAFGIRYSDTYSVIGFEAYLHGIAITSLTMLGVAMLAAIIVGIAIWIERGSS